MQRPETDRYPFQKRIVLGALAGAVAFQAATALAQDGSPGDAAHPHNVLFGTEEAGEEMPLTHWGLDTALPDPNILRRGILYTGRDHLDIVRVSFPIRTPLEDGRLPDTISDHFTTRLEWISEYAGDVALSMLPDTEAGVPDWYKDGDDVIPERWVRLMVESQRRYGQRMETIEPFNEPDYGWGQGPPENLREILALVRETPEFDGVQIGSPSTLNSNAALPWYNVIKEHVDRGMTHALAGSMDTYIEFYEQVVADGKVAENSELHSLAEALAGAEYGLESATWWLAPELARGEFVRAAHGERLGYAENRERWSAAAVYRSPDAKLQAFLATSERQGESTNFRFVSRDRPVFFDGDGPRREYTANIRQDNERVINITWGEDVQQKIDGHYVVANLESGKVLGVAGASDDNGAAVRETDYTGEPHQQWEILRFDALYKDQSYYGIRALHSGKTLGLDDWSHEEEGPVRQRGEGGAETQHWFFEYVGDNNFHIRNRWSTKYLEPVEGGDGMMQVSHSCDSRQQWRLVPVEDVGEGPIRFDTPPSPTGLEAAARPVAVELNWTAGDDTDVTSYTVFRSATSGGPYDTIARGITGTSFIDNEAEGTTPYYYAIQAVDRFLNRSGFSEEVRAAPTGDPALVVDYRFEDDVRDSSGNTNHAVAKGAPAYLLGRDRTRAIYLDGVNDYLRLPNHAVRFDDITIAAWVFSNAPEPWQRVFDFGNDETQYLFLTGRTQGWQTRVEARNGDEVEMLEAPLLPGNQWAHVAFTLEGESARLYVNGELADSSDSWSVRPSDFEPIFNYIGKSQFDADPIFRGRLDDFRIYNHALTSDEVADLLGEQGVDP